MAKDIYGGGPPASLVGPYVGAFAVTASAAELPHVTRGIYINVAGALTIIMPGAGGIGAGSITFANIPAGFHPLRATHITACPAGTIGLF